MRSKNMLCNMIFVLKYYIKFVPTLFFGELLFTVLVSAVWAIQGPVTTKYMLDALIHGKSFKDVLIFLAGVTFIGFVRQAYACYIVEYLRTVADVTMKEKLLRELYQKAVRLDLEYYETPQFYTDYVWAAQQATDQFRKIYNSFVVIVARLSETVFLGGLMVVLDPVLLLLALGV